MATKLTNFLSSSKFSWKDVPDLSSKVALLTGGSEGIGNATAHRLLQRNIKKLIIVSRWQPDSERIQSAVKGFKTEVPNAASRINWKTCDLSDLKQVKSLADSLNESESQLDILINNAAIGIDKFRLSAAGIDDHMTVNFFSPCLLTSILLPLLRKSGSSTDPARVVNLSSNLHQTASSDIRFASMEEMKHDLGNNGNYARTKLALILWGKWFTENNKAVAPIMNAVHPGVIKTEQQDSAAEAYGTIGKIVMPLLAPTLADTWDGCVSTLYAAASPEILRENIKGAYIETPAKVTEPTKQAQDMQLAANLMKLSSEVFQATVGIVPHYY